MSRELTVLGGRYRVMKPLGSGGSAEVYLAEQISLKRKVALKVITRKGPVAADAQARFKREALIHSSIDHPSVVRILDFETDGPEGTVVVLEFVEGVRLDEAVAGHPMKPAEASGLLLQLAEGLGAIHAKGVVHRDFKAENVMLSESAAGKRVRILDFGLARLFVEPVGETGDGRSFVSSSGMVAATPAYAAPEQLRGHPADPRTDVYGFGITAYLMLTGRLPFNGPELHDYVVQQTQQEAPSLEGKVPAALAKLVARCLEKDPAARPADGAALVKLLQEAPPPPNERRSRAPLVGVLVLVSMLGGAAPFFGVEQPWRPREQAKLLLRFGQPARALERLDAQDVRSASLRALALEALGRDQELHALLAEHCIAVVSGLTLTERERLKVSWESCAN